MRALIILGDDVASCLLAHIYRKIVRRGDVLLVARSEPIGYAHALLPYYSAGLVDTPQLISRPLLELADLVRVIAWDHVEIRSPNELVVGGEAYSNPHLVISAWPSCEPLKGRRVLSLETPEDAEVLKDFLSSGLEEAVVLGGAAALPLVDSLVRVGVKPTLVWGEGPFDSDVLSMLLEDLRAQGVKLAERLEEAPRDALHISYAWGWAPQYPRLGLAAPRISVDKSCRVLGLSDVSAFGCATEVVGPEGYTHLVESEEEAMLQATSCALSLAGLEPLTAARYFAARLGDKIYASLGLTQREAERLSMKPAVTRIRGWGLRSSALIKLVASRDARLIGAQLIVGAEAADLLGLLYYAICAKASLHDLLCTLSPLDPSRPILDTPLHHAFWALLRKTALRRLARELQRLEA
ncbi:MAG: hypothetical protein DRK00_00620 [Thermoprotei archaeon]|nr:MAG: hypothetical protein DRK00_00620 [Thermoprotei archaeon]